MANILPLHVVLVLYPLGTFAGPFLLQNVATRGTEIIGEVPGGLGGLSPPRTLERGQYFALILFKLHEI